MNAYDILYKKRNGGELTSDEIAFFVRGITDHSVPDYQAGAWLMAVCLRGMTFQEMRDLTLHIRDSGRVLDLSELGRLTLDKHSTGGVGDKTTLVVVPLLAACGVPMLKMSGRGLGHSGGTIDKLESIPGFRTDLTVAEALAQTKRIGAALIGQSAELAPADKLLYALRDVTATVESVPLIASSVMSKKLASGAGRILLDVKVGRGAFMKTQPEAEELARALVNIGNGVGISTRAVLTAMDEPLGTTVGNALEVREAIATLQETSVGSTEFRTLCLELAAHGLELVGAVSSLDEGREKVEEVLRSGASAAKFAEIVAAQGGPNSCEAILDALPHAPIQHSVSAEADRLVSGMDALAVGSLARDMGGGRATKEDTIDPTVGVELYAKVGNAVKTGQPLAMLHLRTADAQRADEFASRLRAAYTFASPTDTPPVSASPILSIIT
jgi:pyrimidine-nucleoside phosphorylase